MRDSRVSTRRPARRLSVRAAARLRAVVVAPEHDGKGRFHWVDLCFGHYWDTGIAKRLNS